MNGGDNGEVAAAPDGPPLEWKFSQVLGERTLAKKFKKDNLLPAGNKKFAKLADFGLTREESVAEMMTAETGTYRSMAPED